MKLPSKPDSCQSRTSDPCVPIPSHFPMPGRWWGEKDGRSRDSQGLPVSLPAPRTCQLLPRRPRFPRGRANFPQDPGACRPGGGVRRHLAPGLGPAEAGASQAPRSVGKRAIFLKSASRGMLDLAGRALFEILYWEPHTLNNFFLNCKPSQCTSAAGKPPLSPACRPRLLPSRPFPRRARGSRPSQAPFWFLPAAA